ncbi:uncharacterized protein GJ701_015982 [Geothlypis trichas]
MGWVGRDLKIPAHPIPDLLLPQVEVWALLWAGEELKSHSTHPHPISDLRSPQVELWAGRNLKIPFYPSLSHSTPSSNPDRGLGSGLGWEGLKIPFHTFLYPRESFGLWFGLGGTSKSHSTPAHPIPHLHLPQVASARHWAPSAGSHWHALDWAGGNLKSHSTPAHPIPHLLLPQVELWALVWAGRNFKIPFYYSPSHFTPSSTPDRGLGSGLGWGGFKIPFHSCPSHSTPSSTPGGSSLALGTSGIQGYPQLLWQICFHGFNPKHPNTGELRSFSSSPPQFVCKGIFGQCAHRTMEWFGLK